MAEEGTEEIVVAESPEGGVVVEDEEWYDDKEGTEEIVVAESPEGGVVVEDEEWYDDKEYAETALGYWDGARHYLRSFSVWYRWRQVPSASYGRDKPEEGEVDGVHFQQSMGKITLYYELHGGEADLAEDDFIVELSNWELKVFKGSRSTSNTKGLPTVRGLVGELYADIRTSLSWWRIVDNEGGWPGRFLVISLAKLHHGAWKGPWFANALNPHRRTMFGWTSMQITGKEQKAHQADHEVLTRLDPGEPEDDRALCLGIAPEKLCTGVDEEEDEYYATVLLHLDEENFEVANGRVPMEEIFACDVEEEYMEVALRIDGFGFCWGRLAGRVMPELTLWDFTSVRRKPPSKAGIKCPAYYNPALRIKLVKAQGHQYLWGKVFENVEKPDFALPRERMSWTERVQRALVLSPAAPLNAATKSERAQKLVTHIESMKDGIAGKVVVTFHMQEYLEEMARKFRLDLGTFFNLKVGERSLEMNAVADSDFLICTGRFGGPVKPERTTWEIMKVEDHIAIKVAVVMALGSEKAWEEEAFKRTEMWQVVESMHKEMMTEELEAGGAPPPAGAAIDAREE